MLKDVSLLGIVVAATHPEDSLILRHLLPRAASRAIRDGGPSSTTGKCRAAQNRLPSAQGGP